MSAVDRRLKERLLGASILMVLIVLIVPELLSGPAPAPAALKLPTSTPEPVRNITVDLTTAKALAPESVDAAASSARPPDARNPPAASAPAASAAPAGAATAGQAAGVDARAASSARLETRAPAPTSAATAAKPGMRRSASGKMVPVGEPRLDPTLDLKLLSQSEEIKYAGNGRNIFVVGSVPIEKPKANGTDKQAGLRLPPPIQPPPAITLKFFGFANRPGETKKVFLSQGEDVFIAAEGDIVDRRYRVLHISPTAVDVEDVINNNRQSLPLTQG